MPDFRDREEFDRQEFERDLFEKHLNEILVDTFHIILKVQEQAIQETGQSDLTISEMHLIEAVAKREQGRTISSIAQELDITLPSVTVAINKLARKGYVEKVRGGSDARKVYVTLTAKGKEVDQLHQGYHEEMVRTIRQGLAQEEKQVLLEGIKKLNRFFRQKEENWRKDEH